MIFGPPRITGARDVDRALARLEPRLAKKGIRRGLRVGAKMLQAEAVARAPAGDSEAAREAHRRFGTEPLKRQVKVRAAKRSRRPAIGMKVEIGAKTPQPPGAFYAAFKHHGTARMEGDPFAREAFDAKKDAAEAAVVDGIRADLQAIGAMKGPTP